LVCAHRADLSTAPRNALTGSRRRLTFSAMAFALKSLLPAFGSRLLNVVLPPLCLSCGARVDQPHGLCPACWAAQIFIAPPFCQRCGTPLQSEHPIAELTCSVCFAHPPRYGRARAVLQYGDAARKMILGFKHADRTQAAPAFANWMVRAGAELLRDTDVVAPVPLHYRRLLYRKYNQAAMLAVGIAKGADKPVVVDLLKRLRATPSQAGLNAKERRRNVARSISINPARAHKVRGQNVLLIDDVLTTGATVDACIRALKAAGARKVDVLTLARVVRPVHLD
jgi:ComF family protein